jgi:hypothetical protein
MSEAKIKTVFMITKNKAGTKSFWTKIGVGFLNGDGSINVKLDALPTSGEMQIRDYQPRDERTGQSGAPATQAPLDIPDGDDIPF